MSDTFPKPTFQNLFPGDPDLIPDDITAELEAVVKLAWVKLDDLFDSLEGGPHLKDRSLNDWDAEKSALLIPYIIAYINYGQPPLNFNLTSFPYGGNEVLLAQGLVVEIIRHLIRSYTEQPTPQGSGYSHLSRHNYAQAWMPILEKEEEVFDTMLLHFRRSYLNIGGGAGILALRNRFAGAPKIGAYRAKGYRWF